MIFPTRHYSAKVLEPRVGSFDQPPTPVATQFAPIDGGRLDAIVPMGVDQFKSFFYQALTQRIAVISLVGNHRDRIGKFDGDVLKHRLSQIDFRYISRRGDHGQRGAVLVDGQFDLHAFAAFCLADLVPPFFAGMNVASMNSSFTSSRPRSSSSTSTKSQTSCQTPAAVQSRCRRQHVTGEGKCAGRSRQRAPLRSTQTMPSKHSRSLARGRPPSGQGTTSGKKGATRSHSSSVSMACESVIAATPFATKQTKIRKLGQARF